MSIGSGMAIVSTSDLFQQLKANLGLLFFYKAFKFNLQKYYLKLEIMLFKKFINSSILLAERRIRFSLKHSQLKQCLLALLGRCEMALPCFKRMLLVSPLLPDEYLLRADYPGKIF